MSKKDTNIQLDPFQAWCHRWGRIGTVIALIYMVSLPFIILNRYDAVPSLGQVLNLSTLGILAIYIPVGFSEALSYTPLMGTSAYLGFITGNIMNLKMPCAINALQLTGKQGNTPEGDVVSSIAVAASSIMTVIILSIAALFVTAISPVFELPAVKTMADYLLPSMFGSMALGLFSSSKSGSTVVVGGVKGVIPVIVIVSIISLFANIAGFGSTLLGMVGLIILAMLPISIITSRVLWKKGKIKVVENVAEEAPKAE